MTILEVARLLKIYGEAETRVSAVDNVNFDVKVGEFISIVGESGSGKTTLMHIVGGLDRPNSGKVYIADKDIMLMDDEELTVYRRQNIGFIFQFFNLLPICSVYDNIILPIVLDGKAVDEDYIEDIMNTLGIAEKRNNYPNQLSGGQQQRVAIARALASKPKLILADEPTGNLDSKNSQEVMNLLKTSSKKYQQTVIMITHNNALAEMADRKFVMKDGQLVVSEVAND